MQTLGRRKLLFRCLRKPVDRLICNWEILSSERCLHRYFSKRIQLQELREHRPMIARLARMCGEPCFTTNDKSRCQNFRMPTAERVIEKSWPGGMNPASSALPLEFSTDANGMFFWHEDRLRGAALGWCPRQRALRNIIVWHYAYDALGAADLPTRRLKREARRRQARRLP